MPRALDLFCGAGGASMGLHRAGFDVVGVDINQQPNYPFEFLRADAMEWLLDFVSDPDGTFIWAGFDLIWASPPCQHSTAYMRRPGHVKSCENLIPAVRKLLRNSYAPYVIENVVGARRHLLDPVQLCGSSFDLDVRRHRLFECSFPVKPPACDHAWQTPRFPPATNRANLRSTVEVGVWRIPLDVQRKAMGIDWMTVKELSQAIPPAYSEFLAKEFLR